MKYYTFRQALVWTDFTGYQIYHRLFPRQALQMRVLEIQDSAESERVSQSDFDGNMQTDSMLLQMLAACGDNDGFLCFLNIAWAAVHEQDGCILSKGKAFTK